MTNSEYEAIVQADRITKENELRVRSLRYRIKGMPQNDIRDHAGVRAWMAAVEATTLDIDDFFGGRLRKPR